MRLLISFAALFLSVIFLQLGSGGVAPLDAISGLALDFTRAEVGLLGSAHFLGFFIGCWWAPRVMGAVGHSRAFASFTALGTIGILSHMMVVDPVAWMIMRVMSGMCIAGSYTVIEAWLQGKVTNAVRGRTMGTYRVVDIVGSLGAQLLIAVLAPAEYVSYNLLALLCTAALLPIVLTRASPPATSAAPRLDPRLAWARSPLATVAVLTSGLTTASFRMVGPVYGLDVGLRQDQIAYFLAAFVLGGAIAQLPVGWIADKFDRRAVLVGLSIAAILACTTTIALSGRGDGAVMLAAAIFGFATFPIYSVAAAHAHDFADAEERVELSAALLFVYAVGAIAAPTLAARLIDAWGPAAMFWMISVAHLGLIVFSVVRAAARPSPGPRTRYVYAPRTSPLIGRLTKRLRTGNGREDGT